MAPSSRSTAIRLRVERAAGQRRIALGVDALGEPQSHQQEFVGAFFAVEVIVGDDAVAVGLDAHQPGLGTLLGRDRVPAAVDVEPAMRARPDAGIFVVAPVDQIVLAFGAGSGVVGNLVGRQAVLRADFLRHIVERARSASSGVFSLPRRVQVEERRAFLDGELVERQMLGGFGDRAASSSSAHIVGVWSGRA